MKNIIYIIVLLSFFSCKQTKENDVEKKKVNTTDSITIKKNALMDCENGVYLDGKQIPTFNFDKDHSSKSLSYLMDTLYRSFHKSKIENSINRSLKGDRVYVEFAQNYDPSPNIDLFKRKKNIFGFYLLRETRASLEYAELNFPTKYYKNAKRDLFKIKKDTALLDVGMDKALFAKIFNKDVKTLCDTVYVGNETDTSYYIFKDGKLVKVIFNFYTP
jgi:hypothetical protein